MKRWVMVVLVVCVIAGLVGYDQSEVVRRAVDDRIAAARPAPAPAPPPAVVAVTTRVSALGRLEPRDGIRRIAGPSTQFAAVVDELYVDDGDIVEANALLATIDTKSVLDAQVLQAEAELSNAQREHDRSRGLNANRLTSDSETEAWAMRVAVADAALRKAQEEADLASIRAPMRGQVLEVHARPGEVIGVAGILDLAATDAMYAIAEVYETDVQRVRLGQRAAVTSPALTAPLAGTVEWIGLKVHKQDEQGTDPAARKDARVVEVKVRLDESAGAASYTHLQVEVVFEA